MANSVQATKRARQAERRRTRNVAHKTKFRTFQKRAVAAIIAARKDPGDAAGRTAAQEACRTFGAVADAVARKGIIHANKAARIKSRLNTALRQLQPA